MSAPQPEAGMPYTPLREAVAKTHVYPVNVAIERAREALVEQQAANIHDDRAMLAAAVHLEIQLRRLLASLDAQGGES